MTQRWRRKVVEVEVDVCRSTEGDLLDYHVLLDGAWTTFDPDHFEREYEPVPPSGDGHMIDFGAKKIDCPHEASLKLADELAEAGKAMADAFYEVWIRSSARKPTDVVRRWEEALSKYLDSTKGR